MASHELFGGYHVACPNFTIAEVELGYTYCSTPSFRPPTSPTIKFPVISIPPLPFPGHCPRVRTFDKQTEVSPTIKASKFMLYLARYEKTADACDPAPAFSAELTLPCLPVTVRHSRNKVYLKNSLTIPKFSFRVSRRTGCKLYVDYDLAIPCLPAAVTYKRRNVTVARRSRASLSFGITRLTGCRLEFDFDVKIPCMPFSLNMVTNAAVRVDMPSIGAPNTFDFKGQFVRAAETCRIEFRHSFKVPTPCVKKATGVPKGVGVNAGWAVRNELKHAANRCIEHSFDVSVPIIRATINAHLGLIVGGGVPAVLYENQINLFAGGYAAVGTFYMRIPGPEAFGACAGPMLYDVEMKATHSPAFVTPTFVESVLENNSCTKRLRFSLFMPKYLRTGDLATGPIVVNGAYISGSGEVWEENGVLKANLNLSLPCDPCSEESVPPASGTSGTSAGFAVAPLPPLPGELKPGAALRTSASAATIRPPQGLNTAFVRFEMVFIQSGVTLQQRYREFYRSGLLVKRVSLSPISFPRRF